MSEEHSNESFDEEESEEMDEIPGIPDIPGVTSEKPKTEEIPDIPDMPVIPEVPSASEINLEETFPEKLDEEEAQEDLIVEEEDPVNSELVITLDIVEAETEEVPILTEPAETEEEVEANRIPESEEIEEEVEVSEKAQKEIPFEEEPTEDEVIKEEDDIKDESLDIETLETTIEESKEKIKTKPAKKVVTLSIVFTVLSFAMTLVFAFVFNDKYFNWDNVGALKWFPGNFIVEIMVMWILPIVMFFLIIPLYSFFAKMYVRLHKLIKLRRFNYSIVQLKDDPIQFREALGRMVIPLLFLYSIGYWVGTWIFPSDLHSLVPIQMLQYFLYSFLFSPVVVLLAIPLWLLEDSGIIALKKRKEGERKLPDVEGVNNYFHNLYTGSALSIFAVTIVSFIIASIGHFEAGLFGAIAYVFIVLAVESLSFVYLFELFMLRAKKRLLNRIPAKLVDMEPKIVVNLKDVNNDKHEIVDDEEESIDQY